MLKQSRQFRLLFYTFQIWEVQQLLQKALSKRLAFVFNSIFFFDWTGRFASLLLGLILNIESGNKHCSRSREPGPPQECVTL